MNSTVVSVLYFGICRVLWSIFSCLVLSLSHYLTEVLLLLNFFIKSNLILKQSRAVSSSSE